MPVAASNTRLRVVLAERFRTLAEELERVAEADMAERLGGASANQAGPGAGPEPVELLSQAVRAARRSTSLAEMASALAGAAAGLCPPGAILEVRGAQVRFLRSWGLSPPGEEPEIPLAQAPALAEAVESQDTVLALASPAQLSQPLFDLLGTPPDGRAAIVPVVAREVAAALFCARGARHVAALELLAQAVGLCLEATAAPKAADLVSIAPAAASTSRDPWGELPPEERKLHLEARQFARVRIAKMKLYQADAVRAGRASGDLYSSLQPAVDEAREVFRKVYATRCASMVDYIHVELLENLAGRQSAILGPAYPGPLV